MKHARADYDRFQDPALSDPSLIAPGSTPFAEDEPVMLFRAQDRLFVPLLKAYRQLVNSDQNQKDNDKAMRVIRAVDAHILLAEQWQDDHRSQVKSPDLPAVSQ